MYHDDYEKFVPANVREELEKTLRKKEYDGVDWPAVERACTSYFLNKKVKMASLSDGAVGRFPEDKNAVRGD